MITVAGTDKDLTDMTESELSAIIANHNHTIRTHRYVNDAHLSYLRDRVDTCRSEIARRH